MGRTTLASAVALAGGSTMLFSRCISRVCSRYLFVHALQTLGFLVPPHLEAARGRPGLLASNGDRAGALDGKVAVVALVVGALEGGHFLCFDRPTATSMTRPSSMAASAARGAISAVSGRAQRGRWMRERWAWARGQQIWCRRESPAAASACAATAYLWMRGSRSRRGLRRAAATESSC